MGVSRAPDSRLLVGSRPRVREWFTDGWSARQNPLILAFMIN